VVRGHFTTNQGNSDKVPGAAAYHLSGENKSGQHAMIAQQRAILARLWLDAMRAMNTDSYPPELVDYNILMIGSFITCHVFCGHKPPTVSRITRELKIPRTTVTRLLRRMERAGVVGREGNGYYIKELPNLAQGMQHWVRIVLRAAKELTEVGQQKSA
jgi:DNA-binding MarR family transcriptional regulator